jgi:hypothetical protein
MSPRTEALITLTLAATIAAQVIARIITAVYYWHHY